MNVNEEDLRNESRHKEYRSHSDARRPPQRKALLLKSVTEEVARRQQSYKLDFEAQHGPVKIIMKDGKRCL